MHVVVTSIDPVVPDPASPVLAHIAVLMPRYRRRSDGEWVPAVRFADRADTLAIANTVRAAWLNYLAGRPLP
jgi:hypothetical protein